MKWSILISCCITFNAAFSQTLQLHYDARHTIEPKYNKNNFTTFYFDYFKAQDSGKAFIKPGTFLLKMQADLLGEKNNIGKFYMQVSQSFRCWKPNLFLNVQYSGGFGITEPKQYSYYIVNTFSLGVSCPFKWGNAYLTSVINYKYAAYNKPSHDALYTLYWWKGCWQYKAELSGDFSVWTENNNHGDDATGNLRGKGVFFFGEPQFWYHLNKTVSLGTKINMYYHVVTTDNVLNVYPTLAVRCKL